MSQTNKKKTEEELREKRKRIKSKNIKGEFIDHLPNILPGMVDTIMDEAAIKFASLLAKTKITPNQITILGFILFIPLSFYFLSTGVYLNIILGLLFFGLFVFSDFVDGNLARLKKETSELGSLLSNVLGRLGINLIIVGAILGACNSIKRGEYLLGGLPFSPSLTLFNKLNIPVWAIGFFALIGWNFNAFIGGISPTKEIETIYLKAKNNGNLPFFKRFMLDVSFLHRGIDECLIALFGIVNQLFLGILIFAVFTNFLWIIKFLVLIEYVRIHTSLK